MPYYMRKLIVDELILRETFRIINKYLSSFEENEVSIPNFSHYVLPDETSIRLRILYSSDTVAQKAIGFLDQLVEDSDINEYQPAHWVSKETESDITRRACDLAFQCAEAISECIEFTDISQSNPGNLNFPICFFNRLFDRFDIDLNFNLNDTQNCLNDEIQNMINHSIEVISDVELRKEDFFNSHFLERFCHMICNNLLVNPVGETNFWSLFLTRNGPSPSIEECRERFCDNLADS